MSDDRDETSWTRTLRAQPSVSPAPPPLTDSPTLRATDEFTVPKGLPPQFLDLDEHTQPSSGPPPLPHTEVTQPSPWQHEPTRTLGASGLPEADASIHREPTVPVGGPSPSSLDATLILAASALGLKPKRKSKRKSKRKQDDNALAMTAAKSSLAGLATAVLISVVVFFVALIVL